MDGNTEAVVHAFKVDALQERQRRKGREAMTVEKQLRFVRFLRAQWAREGNKVLGVHALTSVIASLERASKFQRQKR